jgi:hypothetical protein
MSFKKLVVKLLEDGHLTLADLALDIEKSGASYEDIFGFKNEVEVLRKLEKEIQHA